MKLSLTLILSGRAYDKLEFDDFDKLRIGRSEDCEVWIDNLGISRYHAEILNHDDALLLRDLGSNNGTLLNDVAITHHGLNSGDVIRLGKFTIAVEISGQRRSGTGPTDEARGDLTLASSPEALAKARDAGASRVRGYLIRDPQGAAETIDLDRSYLLVGKDPDADLHLQGVFAPRLAAVIVREELGFRVIDLSAKATAVQVNGEQRRDTRLNHADRLEIRELSFEYRQGRPSDL